MIPDGAHLPYIVWSYAGVTLVALGLVAWVVWDNVRVKARLAALDRAGIRRRSDGPAA